ncbi:uncharacterized protein L969DRAFT_53973 [Mixia osmundae IAM 14324]|uniref:START domain-containing protein n=1 Tax=Mixia osmundae (strain CBS 9802 / IAM 14324 / JCM 22182 / KY 12970) TaxID=764103 RepID=G7E2Q3_MIXOS|nr:uncharacterized protein L969DRAFT_53973 [Mixia osmundae IAM 14324]KEI36978.1 hypothetical protein L969DRAFT_53973 [Mixia osmundae IAM 14324]GAA97113.1 hypothetical protein E5Q_03788 [Mixia osmundae IAM 14324]
MPFAPRPAPVKDYPTEQYSSEVQAALDFYHKEVVESDAWQDAGDRDGTHIWKKPDADPYGVPTVKGTCLIENATTDEVTGVLVLPAMRKLWDTRVVQARALARYSPRIFAFYTEMAGLSWLVWPRDICGAGSIIRGSEENTETYIVQVSVENPELCPEVDGKVRATLTSSVWHLVPKGDGVEVTYLVKIALNGAIAASLVQALATEIPSCVSRVRDAYYEHGHSPYIVLLKGKEPKSQINIEDISLKDPERTWIANINPATGDDVINLRYSTRMYPDGVKITSSGSGASHARIEDHKDGKATVTFANDADGTEIEIQISPA